MADSTKVVRLTAEIVKLRQQQVESSINAIYVGWTPEEKVAHDQRSDRIALLLLELAETKN